MRRLVFNILIILSILFMPWWIGAIVAILGCSFVDRFYEVIVYGILADAFYGTKFGYHGFQYMATLSAVVIFAAVSTIKKRLAW